ncbi:MAG: hypothetical protein LKE46_06515 [Clostridium sp.]|jgi:hypothetical protein|uniref:hypothetical protein n=1 Tax=Clostridium sp. TaxID=1506 RepID=UPI0025C111B6|nr:hypothetical protein [Clostridium sp.]MCH3963911.1 hypothetical protein [Clostridium sp.]MCI1716112.1 hypothetical protein [Clostridium sp.]MCI1800648.1 hypothetical protein [Clostridium sp.]MCI1814289.1 hypothetical protein [Clostridium sp.]MCI1871188.1 hypothetical protein [Clostridium sp.]
MKRLIRILILVLVAFAFAYAAQLYYYKNHMEAGVKLKNNGLNCELKYKDLKGAVDFTSDQYGNYYIAYKFKIQFIDNSGRSYNIIENKNFDISSIDYKDGKLYYASRDKIYCYSINDHKNTVFVSGIPNYGDYNRSMVRTRGNYLYVSVGAATNSGVVGKDNKWRSEKPYVHDVTPKDITLKGINFDGGSTGAFQSSGTKSINGQVIPGHFPGNASIIAYNMNNGHGSTFAWGIRNVEGMDFNGNNNLVCSVGGMENRGERPVSGDNDYIYEVKKGFWYGWPDYSGGDPVLSPKFRGKNNLGFLLENHPTMNPPSPIYQNDRVSSLGAVAVDTSGNIGEKNCIFFYNKADNSLYSFKSPKVEKNEIEFDRNSSIENIKIYGKSLMILDGQNGYLYSINGHEHESIKKFKQYNNIYIYLISVIVFTIILILRVKRD